MSLRFKLAYHLLEYGSNIRAGFKHIADAGYEAVELGVNHYFEYGDQVKGWLTEHRLELKAVFNYGYFGDWDNRRRVYLHHDQVARLLNNQNNTAIILSSNFTGRS